MHNTLESHKSLFEVIAFWTGECWGNALDFPSRLCAPCSVASQGFARDSSPRCLFSCSGSNRGKRSLRRPIVLSVLLQSAIFFIDIRTKGQLREIAHLLSEHNLDHVRVEIAEEPPQQSPGGKYRTIIPLS